MYSAALFLLLVAGRRSVGTCMMATSSAPGTVARSLHRATAADRQTGTHASKQHAIRFSFQIAYAFVETSF